MAGGFTAAFTQDVLERVVRKSTADLTASTMWIHLYGSTLTDAVSSATTGRCAGDNYAPVNVTNSTATWTAPTSTSPSQFENKVDITFTTSASTGWGTLKAYAVTDSSATGGNYYLWGDISPNQTVSAGNTVQFSTGQLSVSAGGGSAT